MVTSSFSSRVPADRTTTKTRIVFDASAKFRGKSLNSEALPGPKLQADMFSILVRFRKELVALVGDVSQMYHQLVLPLEDRPLHRFLWRNLDQSKEPEVYEFLQIRVWRVLLSFLCAVCMAETCG